MCQGPSVGIETLYDGTLRLTVVLSDIEVDNLGSGPSTTIDVIQWPSPSSMVMRDVSESP